VGRPKDFPNESRSQLAGLARSAVAKVGALQVATALKVDRSNVNKWAKGTLAPSYENARSLAQIVGTTLEAEGLHSRPDRQVAAHEPGSSPSQGTGLALAIRLLGGPETGAPLFPNLAQTVLWNRTLKSPRAWSKAAIVAAAAGAMGDEDLAGDEWVAALDAIDSALSAAKKAIGR
jgi:transcriptional regulator with XRE-family HTH domain